MGTRAGRPWALRGAWRRKGARDFLGPRPSRALPIGEKDFGRWIAMKWSNIVAVIWSAKKIRILWNHIPRPGRFSITSINRQDLVFLTFRSKAMPNPSFST